MRTIFVLWTQTAALISGLYGHDVRAPLVFAAVLTLFGLTGITWRANFEHAGLGAMAVHAPVAVVLCFGISCAYVGLPYLLGLGIRQLLGIR